MSETFLQDIQQIRQNYSKIIFNIGKIRNVDKIYSAYKIPRDETLIAYIKSSVILFTLSVDGNIITDKAIYSHPSHDDWAKNNRVPFSELCRYIIFQPNENAEVIMVNSEEERTIRGNTIFGKNIAGAEIVQFLSDLQKCFLSKYEWAKKQRSTEVDNIISTTRQKMRCGNISDDLDEALDNLMNEKMFSHNVVLLKAEYIFRTCDSNKFEIFIKNIPYDANGEIKKTVINNINTYLSSFLKDLSDIKLDINSDYLYKVYNNIMQRTGLDKEYSLAVSYICIRLWNYEEYNIFKHKMEQLYGAGAGRKLDLFKGHYQNIQMKKVYDKIKKGIVPDDECLEWTDSMGLTPLHYALILKQRNVAEELLESKTWTAKPLVDINDEAYKLYDYNILASYLNLNYRKKICLNTSEELQSRVERYEDMQREYSVLKRRFDMYKMQEKNLYAQYSQAKRENLYDSAREINSAIDSQERMIIDTMHKLDELRREIFETESEINNTIDRILDGADNIVKQLKTSNNAFIIFMLDVFNNQRLLYHIICDESDESRLYIYNGILFVAPSDININLSYYDDPFGEAKRNDSSHCDYNAKYSKRQYYQNAQTTHNSAFARPYGGSWFSPEAHCDEKKLRTEYLKLAKQYHPDVCKDPHSKDIFQEISNEREEIMQCIK